jgi:hypothetical protein
MSRDLEKSIQERHLREYMSRTMQRDNVPQDPQSQAKVAAQEHGQFVRGITTENPLIGLAMAGGSLPYALGKEMYFNPTWRQSIDAALPDAVAQPMWKMLERQVGKSRSQNTDPWGQIGAAYKGFGSGVLDLLGVGDGG